MRVHRLPAIVSAVALCASYSAANASPDAEIELRAITQQLLDAIAPGDTTVWARYLDEQFVHMDENGVVRNKAALMKELRPLPPGLVGRIEIDTFQATAHGKTVVTAYELQEYLDYHGQQLRSRFRAVDTWISTDQGWRLIAEHTAAVLKDPPAISLTPEQRREYEGSYTLTPEIHATIRAQAEGLLVERKDRPPATYQAEVRDVFFVAGQPRVRRIFTRDAAGKIDGFVDRREGEDIRWTRDAR